MSDFFPPLTLPADEVDASTPIVTDHPDHTRSLVRKYTSAANWSPDPEYARELKRSTPGARTALRTLDTQRVARGSSPYASKESAFGLRAASDNAPATPERDQSLFEALSSDARAFFTSIPKLPAILAQEPGDIWAHYTGQKTTPIGNPFDLAKLPGLRMVPGSFIAGQFGTGADSKGFAGLAEHPLFTALDVLPYASKAAKLTPTVQRAIELAGPQADVLGIAPRVKPLSTLARNWSPKGVRTEAWVNPRSLGVTPSVERLAPNALGRALDRAGTAFNETRPGATLRAAFGEPSRVTSQIGNRVWFDEATDQITRAQKALDEGTPMPADIKPAAIAMAEANKLSADLSFAPSEARAAFDEVLGSTDRASTLASLTPELRAYVEPLMDITDRLLADKLDRGIVKAVTYTDDAGKSFVEHLPAKEADAIFAAREASTVAQDRAARAMFAKNPTLAAPHVDHIIDELPAILRGDLPGLQSISQRRAAIRASLSTLDQLGYDVRSTWDAVTKADTKGKMAFISNNIPQSFPLRASASELDNAVAALKSSSDPMAVAFRTQVASGDWSAALGSLRALKQRTTHSFALPWKAVRDDLQTRILASSATSKLDQVGWSDAAAAKAAKQVRKVEVAKMPGRFAEPVRKTAATSFIDDARAAVAGDADALSRLKLNSLSHAEADAIVQAVNDHTLFKLKDVDPTLLSTYSNYYRDAKKSWMDMRAQGVDPFFIHNVTPAQAKSMRNAFVLDYVKSLSAAKDKGASIERAPSSANLVLSVTHDAFELLQRDASETFVRTLGESLAIPMSDALRQFEPRAQAIAARTGRNYNEVLMSLTEKHFSPFDPTPKGMKKRAGMTTTFADTKFVIPREAAANLDKLMAEPGALSQMMQVPMKLFRTSILPLSPRWHLNNVAGGAILVSVKAGPSAFRHTREAWRMAREGTLERIPGAPAQGEAISRMAWGDETMAGILKGSPEMRLASVQSYFGGRAAGKTLNNVANQLGDRGITWISKATDAGGNVVQHSYKVNQMFDDFYRSLAYLSGEQKALAKGMTATEAQRAGVAMARDILQNWDRMTPIERGIVRSVFPFYSWASHVIRFSTRYVADHPLRLSVAARLADHEYNDHLSGVPQRLRDMLFLGDVNDGQVTGISVSGTNPFRDLANYPALVGFLTGQEGGNMNAVTGQINPVMGAAMESIGIDPAFGADLYPELEYDPTTGGLRVATKAFPMSLATNILPHLNSVTAIAGWNADFKRLAITNPDAAARQLQSSIGLPILSKTVDMDQEQIKAEITRYRQQQDERSSALKSGDLSRLGRWPALRELQARAESLTPTQRARMTPVTAAKSPGLWDLLPALVPTKTAG